MTAYLSWGMTPQALTNTAPFTYRDNATYLEKLHDITDMVNTLIDNVASNADAQNLNNTDVAAKFTQLVNDWNATLANLDPTAVNVLVAGLQADEDALRTQVLADLATDQAAVATMQATADTMTATVATLTDSVNSLGGRVTVVEGSYVPKSTLLYLPADYGAVGDGVADDTAAVQAALTAAAGNGAVQLSKTYKVTTTLTVPDHSVIIGQGTITATGFNVLSVGAHCTVSDITLTESTTDGVGAAILVTGDNSRVSHVNIVGFRWGVDISDASYVEVSHCDVSSQRGANVPTGIYAVALTKAISGITIHHNRVHDMAGCGIMVNLESLDADMDTRIDITENIVNTVTDNGIRVQTKNGRVQRGWTIANNKVTGATVNAIRINGTGVVSGNMVTGSAAGIRDGGGVGGTAATECIIIGNKLYGLAYAGAGIQLQLGASANKIIGNDVANWNFGIYLGESGTTTGSCVNHVVSNNTIHDNGRDAIIATNVTDLTITGNRAWDNGHSSASKAAVNLSACQRVMVANNTAGNTGTLQTYGLLTDATCDYLIVIGNNWAQAILASVINGTHNAVKANVESGKNHFDKDSEPLTVLNAAGANDFQNTWNNVGGYPMVLTAKNGYVAVSGILTLTTLTNVGLKIVTLPPQFWPSQTQFLVVPSNKGHLWVMTVATNGDCVLSATYGVGVSGTATAGEYFQLAGQYAL